MERRAPRKKRTVLHFIILILLLAVAITLTLVVAEKLEKRTYRLMFPELIDTYAAQYSLDPYLVAAMIHCESSNRPEVISRSGAIGLMQVMPETGEWIAGKLNRAGFTPEDLKKPETNIQFGCWYLRFLLDRYSNNRTHAVAAYNAGHGNVDTWLLDPSVTTNNTLTNIPFPETADYVEKVLRAHEKYEKLYSNVF